jgi:hypothetical protein
MSSLRSRSRAPRVAAPAQNGQALGGWAAPLAHTLSIKNGPTLATLHDARAYILKQPAAKVGLQWESAIRLLLKAAETATPLDVRQSTRAIELAFLFHGQLPLPPEDGRKRLLVREHGVDRVTRRNQPPV